MLHVFNGDCLIDQIPDKYAPYVVMRECLIEGPNHSDDIDIFWKDRAAYLSRYKGKHNYNYNNHVVREIEQLKNHSAEEEVCLWFEFDLFCQLNMWFIIHYLDRHTAITKISWAFPNHKRWTGFGSMSHSDFEESYDQRIHLTPIIINDFCKIWQLNKGQAFEEMKDLRLSSHIAKVEVDNAIQALIELHPLEGASKPIEILEGILSTHSNVPFDVIFKAFSKEAGIYGYGDMQVKEMVSSINH